MPCRCLGIGEVGGEAVCAPGFGLCPCGVGSHPAAVHAEAAAQGRFRCFEGAGVEQSGGVAAAGPQQALPQGIPGINGTG
ncbi:MAG: hypothetical protein H6559_09855 [Lewinellaceae bacterium]|nr:hypothetical protein [Lewinellaceae bacterium]